MQAAAKNGQVMNGLSGRFAARRRVAAVLRSNEEAAALCDVVHGISDVDFEIHLGGIGEICRSLTNSHAPDVLLVDLDPDMTSALEELSRFFHEHPERPQILASAEAAPVDTVRRLMRLGVADFIPKPLDREDV